VIIGSQEVTDHPPQRREVGFVFQHYAAFKHMSVADNVGFGLAVKRRPKAEIKAKVQELLHLVGLEHLGKRYPSQLSGGQRQRMALARALAVEPQVLLLDEPFGALDARVREELRAWLRRLHDEVHVTTIFVTHDQEEALEISEQIVVINEGRVEQSAAPQDVYDNPANDFVMSFVGPVTRVNDRLVRPHDVEVLEHPGEGTQPAEVTRLIRLGFEIRAELQPAEGELLSAQLSRAEAELLELAEGQIVHVRVEPIVTPAS
jgi:sulfate transport system ATP-binding protein